MAALPFTFRATLELPPEAAQGTPVEFSYEGSADSVVRMRLPLTGAATRVIDLGATPAAGAKLVWVSVEATQGNVAVQVYVNGSLVPEEITPGGARFLVSPSPVSGITALAVEHADDTVVNVLVLG